MKIRHNDINLLQEDAAEKANNVSFDQISRGTFGNEHITDSVIFTARDFSSLEATKICGNGGALESGGDSVPRPGALATRYPMTINGPRWETSVTGPDATFGPSGISALHPTRDYNDPVYIAKDRSIYWQLVKCASSRELAKTFAEVGSTEEVSSTLLGMNTPDWTGTLPSDKGALFYDASWKGKFGEYLFKIGNDGFPFSLFFYNNFEIKTAMTFLQNSDGEWDKAGSNRYRRWEGGCRVWTSVVYFLKPNIDAPFVLKWSPRHMIGCSAASWQTKKASEGKDKLDSPMINEIHAYQDVIHINNTMIQSLCEMSGKTYTNESMGLSGDAAFGWGVLAGIDRWDGYYPSYDRVDPISPTIGVHSYTYSNGQPVTIDNGNSGFIAFNYDVGKSTSQASSTDRNVSLYNNFIGL